MVGWQHGFQVHILPSVWKVDLFQTLTNIHQQPLPYLSCLLIVLGPYGPQRLISDPSPVHQVFPYPYLPYLHLYSFLPRSIFNHHT